MKCADMRELLSAYADGELGYDELELVEAHLVNCDECQRVLEDYRHISKQISRLRAMPIETDIMAETMAKVNSTHTRRWQPPAWQMVGIGMVLIALIIGLVLSIPQMGGKTDFALAAEKIVRNSEAFKTASAGEGDVSLEQVIRMGDDEATVIFSTERGKQIVAQVDVKAKRVMELKILGLKLEFPPNPEFDLELTETEREEAIAIAETDPVVSDFVAKGAVITHVWGRVDDGRRVADIGIIPGDLQGGLVIDGNYLIEGKSVRVDLDNKKVLSINEFGIATAISLE